MFSRWQRFALWPTQRTVKNLFKPHLELCLLFLGLWWRRLEDRARCHQVFDVLTEHLVFRLQLQIFFLHWINPLWQICKIIGNFNQSNSESPRRMTAEKQNRQFESFPEISVHHSCRKGASDVDQTQTCNPETMKNEGKYPNIPSSVFWSSKTWVMSLRFSSSSSGLMSGSKPETQGNYAGFATNRMSREPNSLSLSVCLSVCLSLSLHKEHLRADKQELNLLFSGLSVRSAIFSCERLRKFDAGQPEIEERRSPKQR